MKDKWVAALRSGKYTQGRGYLNSNGSLCCLGVLCEIAGVEKRPSNILSRYEYKGTFRFGPSYIDFELLFPDLFSNINPYHLTLMNDILDKSFNEIADYIEEHA